MADHLGGNVTVRVYLTEGDSVKFDGVTETRCEKEYYEVRHENDGGVTLFPWHAVRKIIEIH